MRALSVVLIGLICTQLSVAQSPDVSKLNLDRIFASEDFRGDRLPAIKWLDSGEYTSLLPSKTHKSASDLVRVKADGQSVVLVKAEQLIPAEAAQPLVIQGYQLSQDLDLVLIFTNTVKVWRQNTRGDYWTFRRSTGQLRKVGQDAQPSRLMFAKLSPQATHVGYVYENNLYVESIDGGPAQQLTRDGQAEVINGTFDWVYEEEFDCRDGWRWSPDGKSIAYWQLNTQGVKSFTLIDNTRDKYPVLTTFAYPKTGEHNSACRVGVIPTNGGQTKWIHVPGDTRTDFYIPRMDWAGNSEELVLLRANRLQNTLEVMLANVPNNTIQTLLTERDSAWVDIPDDIEWINQGKAFTWMSERDGWRSFYVASRDGSKLKKITTEAYDVIRLLRVDEKAELVYFLASPDNPTQRYLYCKALDGTTPAKRLTPAHQSGWHEYNISDNGQIAIHTWSALGTPPRIELISLPNHQQIRPLAENKNLHEMVSRLAPAPVEFFRTDIGQGIELDGWLMKPADFDPSKNYPILFHVYGEPAGQTVVDRWGGTNYLWHRMLTQQGYVVASVDNRGTPSPRGRDWRKVVYRQIGTLASQEQAAAARAILRERPYLDAKRVGVWGWSGGGSMTLNLLFRSPDLYRTGISVAPVPDMRLYDTIYQERYMGLPQDHERDYLQGSPITHASGLKGNLLLIHGTGDDNCHYQGIEKLADKLIELNKPFTMMAYPNRSHSINEGKNTSRHLYGLMTRYLNENLPRGAR